MTRPRTPQVMLLASSLLVALAAAPCWGQAQPPLSLTEIEKALAAPDAHTPFLPTPPLGFTADDVARHVPKDNPITKAKVELGRQLYFDARLSKDNTVSCASCHHPRFGFADGAPTSTGIRGQKGGRSAPTVTNRLFSGAQFWDGRAKDLEEQALGPIGNPIEMGSSVEEACKTVQSIPGYRMQVKAVFGSDTVEPEHLAKAMAAFERTVISGSSPYDYFSLARDYAAVDLDDEDLEEATKARVRAVLAGAKKHPLSESAQRGEKLFFGKANCNLCHANANFTDEKYWNLGVGMSAAKPDLGRYEVTKDEKDKGAFKTPTLRNVADTAPYMHDGSAKTLADVVELYDRGGEKNPWLSDRMKPLDLTAQEKADLVAFMEGLSGVMTPVKEPRLPGDPVTGMDYLKHILLILLAAGLLWKGADEVVEAASRIARSLGVSDLIIGLTVVAFGTSAPEFAVTIHATLTGHADISIANIVGSNIFNLGFILGGCACFVGLKTTRTIVYRDGGFLIAVTVLLRFFLNDQLFAPWEGAVLFSLLIAYLTFLFVRKEASDEEEIPEGDASWKDYVWLFFGIAAVGLGGHLMTDSAVFIAKALGISEWAISVTVVAACTSLPELATSMMALYRGRHGLSIGNLIGSDLFNLLGVLGLAGMLGPFSPSGGALEPDIAALNSTLLLVFMVTLVVVFMRTGWEVSRREGLFLVIANLIRWYWDLKPPGE